MKNLKKTLSLLLSLMFVLGTVAVGGTSVLAAEEYNLWVGGVKVTDDNKDDVLGDGTVSYDPVSSTLTLNNATITGDNYGARIRSGVLNLTIVLVGNNVLTEGAGGGILTYNDGNLKITGSGTLDTSANTYPISSTGTLTIENTSVVAKSNGYYSIESNFALTITNSYVSAESTFMCISGDPLILDNVTITEPAGGQNNGYKITLNGQNVQKAVIQPPYSVNLSANPTEGGTVTGGGTYNYGGSATVTATPNENYRFVNWTENGDEVSTDAEYTFTVSGDRELVANFEIQKFTVQFVNDDGTELQSGQVIYGGTPAYTGEMPTKEATAQYTYSFLAWTPAIVPVTDDATYTATYTQTPREYEIKFVNEDGSELQKSYVAYGETPVYTGETPTKEQSDQYVYTFGGWSPEITGVTGEATYTATFTQAPRKYEIKFVNEDGTELQSGDVAYGETPKYTGETPTKEQSDQYVYTFGGWDPEITSVMGEATYTATYTQSPREYEIKFVNEDGTELQSSDVAYGETPVYTGETPTKEQSDQYVYTFGGWSPEITGVTGEATYTATFTQAPRKYEIKFVNEDGTELQSSSVAYGETPVYTGETPTKEQSDQYVYTFAGWSPEISQVSGEATYTATFTQAPRKYEIKFVNEDGTVLQSSDIAYGETPEYKGETPVKAETDKATYTFKGWSPEIAPVTGEATYTAAFTETKKDKPAKAEITIKGDDALTLNYRQNKTFTADTKGIPEGGKIQWYLNGEKAGEGKTFKVENPEDDYIVQSKIVDKDGNTVAESETVKVTVKHGFFDKLKAWLTDLLLGVFAPLFSKFESVC